VIDSGYRGEIQATFNQKSLSKDGQILYGVGDRIMQIIIIPYPPIEFKEVDELTNTERGEGGFGSTGK
jgi:dUTP pyrophosphatase